MKTIIEMARKAGLEEEFVLDPLSEQRFLAFERLAAAKERERLLAGAEMPEPAIQASLLMPEKGGLYGPCYTADQLRETVAKAVARTAIKMAVQEVEIEVVATERDALKAEVERLKAVVARNNTSRSIRVMGNT